MATFRGIQADPGGPVVLTIRRGSMTVRHSRLEVRSALSDKAVVTWIGIKTAAVVAPLLLGLGLVGYLMKWDFLTYTVGGHGVFYVLLLLGGLFHKLVRSDGDLTWLGSWVLCWPVLLWVNHRTEWTEQTENGMRAVVLPGSIAEAWAGHYGGRPWATLRFVNGSQVTYWLLPSNAADVVKAMERLTGGRVRYPPMARA